MIVDLANEAPDDSDRVLPDARTSGKSRTRQQTQESSCAFAFMSLKILITGGAGFIGSHLADHLIAQGCQVRVLDMLIPQVHGTSAACPEYLSGEVEFIRGDVRDADAVRKAVKRVDAVFHFAAAVGVGQSMYQIRHYSDVNAVGTAVLLETLAHHPVGRLVIASSMSVYGEGLYQTKNGKMVDNATRTLTQLRSRQWDPIDENGEVLLPIATPESKVPAVPSVYALLKYHQERLCMSVAPVYGISAVALRFFNVFGPRQSLSNPYTGVLAIFASRLLNNRPPIVNEDGRQRRDFVYIKDLIRACGLALSVPEADGQVFNVGSGESTTILEIANKLIELLDKPTIQPQIGGRYRVGDIRNCFADISFARKVLGYYPTYTLESGISEMLDWFSSQPAEDRVSIATSELEKRGLTV
jgi:dTDP-L-rhamnose 4-epimerase